jgi:hypothetical protein
MNSNTANLLKNYDSSFYYEDLLKILWYEVSLKAILNLNLSDDNAGAAK